MRLPFKTNKSEGAENIMYVGDINPDEIIFNRETREISLVCYSTYTMEDLDGESWQKVKHLVLKNGGKWTTKADDM